MLKIYIIIIALIVLPCNIWAGENLSEKPIIDDKFRQTEIQLEKETKSCRGKGKNTIQVIACSEKIRKKYENDGMLRGTEEYCKKQYGELSFKDLRNVWKKLKKQRRKARISPNENIPGEVDEGMFMSEEFWVESRLAQMQRAGIKRKEKEVFKKSQTGRRE